MPAAAWASVRARSSPPSTPVATSSEILDRVDLEPIVELPIGKSRAALLCVERDPEACHRSLIAARLRDEWHFEVEDLKP